MEVIQSDPDPNTGSSYASSASLRKIEFHPARKPFYGFSSNGFKIETLNPSSGNNGKRPFCPSQAITKQELFEHGLDQELNFSITFRKIGAGLRNLGNTCFLNSVLQCLTYTEPFAAWLHNAAHQQRCRVAGFCALCAMQKHVRNARQATGRILAPSDLVSNLRCVSRNFRKCRQEDAHEYMISLLECMHKCSLASGVPSESSDAYRTSLVHRIFGGCLRSQVKCENCHHCSDKFDPFLDLSLDISRADSLQRALSRFTAVEYLDDGRKVYQCEGCKQKVKARKQLTVSKAPSVLTIHLKRFEAHHAEKIDKKVQFPSAIDMKPFVSGKNEGNLRYTLYGVLVHYGRGMHSGHYACFVRTSTGMWYCLDDNRVFQVSEKAVFNEKAYMLFYVRDRQNAALKSAVTVVNKKEVPKESLATTKASLTTPSNVKDQVSGSTVLKPCGLKALVANGPASAPLAAPAVLTQENPQTNVEAIEILKKDNGSAPLKSCEPSAPAVSSQNDLTTKESLSNEAPLPLGNGEGSMVKEDSLLPGKELPVLNGSTNTETLVSLPTSLPKAEISLDEKKSANSFNEPNSLEVKTVSVGDSSIVQTLAQNSKESTLVESVKATSDVEIVPTSRKIRKHSMKTLHVGLKFFKRTVGLRKKKKQNRGISSTLAVPEVPSKERATGQEGSTSQMASEVASNSGKDNSASVHSNGNVLVDSPLRSSELLVASQNAKRKREESSKEEQIKLQEESLSILTRGLPETLVAKWDDVSASRKMGSEKKGKSIGYVADEWDEAYDQGKKKKIRIKEERIVGPNPFQLLATRKNNETKNNLAQRMNTAKTGFRI